MLNFLAFVTFVLVQTVSAFSLNAINATSWGHWYITNLEGVSNPSFLGLQFHVLDDNKPGAVICRSVLTLVGPENAYYPCQDPTLQFTVNENLTSNFSIKKCHNSQLTE